MSKPKGERRQSTVEYVKEARAIREQAYSMHKRLPKAWAERRARHILDLACRLSDECQTANDIYVTCEAENAIRLASLWAAHGACRCLQNELSYVYGERPTREVLQRTADGRVARDEQGRPVVKDVRPCIGDRELELLQQRVTDEANLIKGVIEYERERGKRYTA